MRERPKHVVWIEVLTLVEFGLFLALTISEPLDDANHWKEGFATVLILGVTFWFTRGGAEVARRILIALNLIAIPASIYLSYLYAPLQLDELLWDFFYLSMAIAFLILLLSKPTREWAKAMQATSIEQAAD